MHVSKHSLPGGWNNVPVNHYGTIELNIRIFRMHDNYLKLILDILEMILSNLLSNPVKSMNMDNVK